MAKRHATLRISESWHALWDALPEGDERPAELGRQAFEIGLVLLALARSHPVDPAVARRVLLPVLPDLLTWTQAQGLPLVGVPLVSPPLAAPADMTPATVSPTDVQQMEQAADDLSGFFADE